MADPLSVTASIVALLQLTQVVVQGLSGMKDASKERLHIRDEIIYVSGLLFNLKGQLTRDEIWSGIISSLNGPRGPLEQLKEALEQLAKRLAPAEGLRKLGSSIAWPFQKSEVDGILGRIERQKAFIMLAMENSHINLSQALKEDLSVVKTELGEIKDGVKSLQLNQEDRAREQETREILAWTSPLNSLSMQKGLLLKAQGGTGQWVLDSEQFRQWCSGSQSMLWCSGPPGVGKTILASIIIDHVERSLKDDEAIAYIFCNYKEHGIQTAENILSSILQQLYHKRPFVSDELTSLYRFHTRRQTRPSLLEWSKLLQSEARLYSRVFIVIDAFDECSDVNSMRVDLLTEVRKVLPTVHLAITSRPLLELGSEFKDESRLEILARDGDIRRYLESRVDGECRLATQIKKDPSLREIIITCILKAADGMFLAARLHMDSVAKKYNRQSIDIALQTLPKRLDETYEETMKRISEQEEDDAQLAERILSWISFARRPLTLIELQHALAVGPYTSTIENRLEINTTHFGEDYQINEGIILSVCAGLATIDYESRMVRLVHYTAQQYLERVRFQSFPRAQQDIAYACLAYISLEEFGCGYCHNDYEMEQRLARFPFYNYAARYWGYHARDVSDESLLEFGLEFLQCNKKFESAVQLMHLSLSKYSGYSQQFPRDASALQICASFDLEDMIQELLSRGVCITAQDENGWTALHRAAENGHVRLVELLLDKGLEINLSARNGGTALHRAAKNGHKEVIDLLIERHAEIDANDQYGGTALHRAAKHGHGTIIHRLIEAGAEVNRVYSPEIVRDLLNRNSVHEKFSCTRTYSMAWEVLSEAMSILEGADIHSEKFSGGAALHEAAQNGHTNVIELLINMNAAVGIKDNYGGTALHRGAARGHARVAELLIEAGTDVNAMYDPKVVNNLLKGTTLDRDYVLLGKLGGTPLHQASEQGCIQVMEVLLRKGANPNALNENDLYPLHLAVKAGHYAAVAILLEHGADITMSDTSRDETGSEPHLDKTSPLHLAARYGHTKIVRLLLENGAAVDDYDLDDGTPLHEAIRNGHSAAVSLLIEFGSDLSIKAPIRWDEETAVQQAIRRNHPGIISTVLESVSDKTLRGDDGVAALVVAAEEGHEAIVQLLLQRGAQIDTIPRRPSARDKLPLHQAVVNGQQSIFKLLADHDPTLDLNTEEGSLFLHLAASDGSSQIAELLLKRGVDLERRNERGETVLFSAVKRERAEIIKMLLSRGADLNIKDNEGRTPLSWATYKGSTTEARLLLENGADPNSADKNGWTPMRWAFQSLGTTKMISLLLSHGAQPNRQDASGQTVLKVGAEQGMAKSIDLLLEEHAHLNIQGHQGETVLSEAYKYGDDAVVLVLENGAVLRSGNLERSQVIRWANRQGYERAVALLFDNMVNDNTTIEDKSTMLLAAVKQGTVHVAEMLIESGANINVDPSSLHQAVENKNHEMILLLLERGAEIDRKDDRYRTPILCAANNIDIPTMRLLIEHGADTSSGMYLGYTLLYEIMRNGHKSPVELLLNQWNDPMDPEWRGSAKSQGYRRSCLEAVWGLLDRFERSPRRARAWKMMSQTPTGHEHMEILKLLIQKGPRLDEQEEQMVVEKAAAKGYTEVVELARWNRLSITTQSIIHDWHC